MLNNQKGTITLLGMYICLLMLFLSILTKTILLENYYYYQQENTKYNLFLIENAIVKNIYDDFENVNYSSKDLSYISDLTIVNDNYEYKIKLSVYKDVYEYYVVYDHICHKIIEFNNISTIKKIWICVIVGRELLNNGCFMI